MVKADNPYDQRYAGQDYYWGHKPSAMCDRVLQFVQSPTDAPRRLLDLGCGEGRNAVYFAQHGFQVVGLDASVPGLKKTQRYAAEVGVQVEMVAANIVTYDLTGQYDVIFSTGTLQYLPPELREQRFQQYKDATVPGGLNAMSVFVYKPFIPRAPDGESTSYRYRSGELLGYYWDWEILYCTEEIFDCMSGGVPHQHTTDRVIARKR
jgi:tellurite methyltransferase